LRKNESTDVKHCGAWLARRKSAGIFRAFAAPPGRMPQGIKCEVIFARALSWHEGSMADLIRSIGDSPLLMLYACPLAFLFGAVHTFLPGHGKTIVCGYCVGRKRDVGKILFVTAVAVITHLFSSALLGVVAMTSSQVLVRNVILPKIQIGAACILILFGLGLLVSAVWKLRGHNPGHSHIHPHTHHHDHDHGHSHGRLDSMLSQFMAADHVPFHHYTQLFWLGLAAGLIPCLEPFTLMLFAIALDRVLLGFALLISFGLGVFTTMVALSLVVTSEKLSPGKNSESRFFRTAGKAALVFKIIYPALILILGSGWLYAALSR
jgi:nickel/cobalt exporter